MKSILFFTRLFCLILFLTACKTYQPIDWVKPKVQKEQRTLAFEERQLEKLSVGDSLHIERLNADPVFLIFHSISNDSIKGVVWKTDKRRLQIPIESGIPIRQVKAIEVRKFDTSSTLLFVFVALPVFTLGIAVGYFAICNCLNFGF